MGSHKKVYAIAKGLERAAVRLLVTDPRFYAIIGHAIDPVQLPTPQARLVAELALAFYRSTGGACTPEQRIIAQRLRQLREQGKLSLEDAGAVYDWLDGVMNDPKPEREAVAFELTREVRSKIRDAAVLRTIELHGRGASSLTEVIEQLQMAERLGEREASTGFVWDETADTLPLARQNVERLATSIQPLDAALHGGLGRGEFGFGIGGYGAGKSLLLSQLAASAMTTGHNPFIVTLEISEDIWGARLKAAKAGVRTRSIREGELTPRDVEVIKGARGGAVAYIVTLPAKVTQIEDVWRAFDEANRELERRGSDQQYDVLLVDYADKLGWPKHMKGSYEGFEHVYERLRLGGKDRNIWTWTASQAKRKESKGKKNPILTGDEVADSIHKCRAADVVITINPTAERDFMRVYVDKDRNGDAAGFLSDLLPTDYEYGRITPPLFDQHELGMPARGTTQALPF